tara:strand:- start:1 stop:474 length:474 start_codon:yes stop_codon:yes gene_type:complete
MKIEIKLHVDMPQVGETFQALQLIEGGVDIVSVNELLNGDNGNGHISVAKPIVMPEEKKNNKPSVWSRRAQSPIFTDGRAVLVRYKGKGKKGARLNVPATLKNLNMTAKELMSIQWRRGTLENSLKHSMKMQQRAAIKLMGNHYQPESVIVNEGRVL